VFTYLQAALAAANATFAHVVKLNYYPKMPAGSPR
jgi:hypothetical protein